jgi:spondin N
MKRILIASLGLMIAVGGAATALAGTPSGGGKGGGEATKFTVTIEDVSTETTLQTSQGPKPVPLSPGVFATYRGNNILFREGKDADEGTENIAEDGFPEVEAEDAAGHRRERKSGIFTQEGGALGPAFEPGSMTEFSFRARRGDRFSLETMFVQSNDWFYGFDGLKLFRKGEPISGDVTRRIDLYDAGTEVDEEPGAGTTQKPNQDPDAMDVGPSENEPVTLVSETGDGFSTPPNDEVIRVTITPAS